jgi:putative NADPH-quinone reductase
MPKSILIIQGHPDPSDAHFGHALARVYREGAERGGHTVEQIVVAELEFPLLRSKQEFEKGLPPESIRAAQDAILRADHLVIFYPLWLGDMPSVLKGFLEQVFRPGFVAIEAKEGMTAKRRLNGRTARIVVTMGMPAFFYRWFFRAHTLKNLKRNIFGFCGIKTVGENLIGFVESPDDTRRKKWLLKMEKLGAGGK